MNNQKGVTLIELLAAIVILGIIIVPILSIMTGTTTRTVNQGKETELAYIAQEVMEKVRLHSIALGGSPYCWSHPETLCGTNTLPAELEPSTIPQVDNVRVVVNVSQYNPIHYPNFNEVSIRVVNESYVSNGSGVQDKQNVIELATVVRKP